MGKEGGTFYRSFLGEMQTAIATEAKEGGTGRQSMDDRKNK